MMNNETIAKKVAMTAHAKQLRRDGRPYTEHLRRVAEKCDTDTEKAIAWLHDVLEDTPMTANQLIRKLPEGKVSQEIVETVILLTHNDEPYEDYIQDIFKSPLAAKIKIFDMEDNVYDRPTPKQVRKYVNALLILVGKITVEKANLSQSKDKTITPLHEIKTTGFHKTLTTPLYIEVQPDDGEGYIFYEAVFRLLATAETIEDGLAKIQEQFKLLWDEYVETKEELAPDAERLREKLLRTVK